MLSLVLGGVANESGAPASVDQQQNGAPVEGWVVKKSNHICGLSDAKKLSNPATIAYQKCLEATAPWKEMVDEGFDEDSVEGKALRSKAVRVVAKAAKKVYKDLGHCSVWKKIKHSDGRDIVSITDKVIAEVEEQSADA